MPHRRSRDAGAEAAARADALEEDNLRVHQKLVAMEREMARLRAAVGESPRENDTKEREDRRKVEQLVGDLRKQLAATQDELRRQCEDTRKQQAPDGPAEKTGAAEVEERAAAAQVAAARIADVSPRFSEGREGTGPCREGTGPGRLEQRAGALFDLLTRSKCRVPEYILLSEIESAHRRHGVAFDDAAVESLQARCLRQHFDSSDANRDLRLSRQEWGCFAREVPDLVAVLHWKVAEAAADGASEEGPAAREAVPRFDGGDAGTDVQTLLAAELRRMDKNGDGMISLSEFRLFWRAVFPSRTRDEIAADTSAVASSFGIGDSGAVPVDDLAGMIVRYGRTEAALPVELTWRDRLWGVVGAEDDEAPATQAYHFVQHAAVVAVVAVLLMESHPDFNEWEDGTPSSDFSAFPPRTDTGYTFFLIECACMLAFVSDFLLSIVSYPLGPAAFLKQASSWIDLVTMVPFFVTLGTANLALGSSVMTLRLVRTVRLLRAARVLKLGQGISAFEYMIRAGLNASWSMFWLFLLLAIVMIVSSSLIFYAELGDSKWSAEQSKWVRAEGNGTVPTTFQSTPDAMWWSVVTLTTVGYGDLYPVLGWGKVVASFTMLTGLFVIGFPTTVLSNSFQDVVNDAEAQEALKQQAGKLIRELQSRAESGGLRYVLTKGRQTPDEKQKLVASCRRGVREAHLRKYFHVLWRFTYLCRANAGRVTQLVRPATPKDDVLKLACGDLAELLEVMLTEEKGGAARAVGDRLSVTRFEEFWCSQLPAETADRADASFVFGHLAGDPAAEWASLSEVVQGICAGGREHDGGVWRLRTRFHTDGQTLRDKVWDVVSGRGMTTRPQLQLRCISAAYMLCGVLFVLLSVGTALVETLPELRDDEGYLKQEVFDPLYALEFASMVWFTLDLVLVCVSFPGGVTAMARDLVVWVEVATLVPMYINAATADRNVEFSLNPLRVFRAIRICRLVRHSSGLHLLVEALVRARLSLQWLLVFLLVAMLVSSALVFYAELDQSHWEAAETAWVRNVNSTHPDAGEQVTFQSIPSALWWSLVTLTTVGYGDQVPKTGAGKAIGGATMLAGLIVIGFPMTILTNAFAEVRDEHKEHLRARRLITTLARHVAARHAVARVYRPSLLG